MSSPFRTDGIARCACALALSALAASEGASAASLAAKAKEEGCTARPTVVEGTSLFKCSTPNGMHYFNLGGAPGEGGGAGARGGSAPAPQGFPRVDAETQRNRDSIRRKVLSEELAAEERALAKAVAEAKAANAGGTSPAVALHEKNIEALKKELGATR